MTVSNLFVTTKIAAALKKTQPPPAVPARGDSVLTKKPPEIPPKRHSLKKPIEGIDGSPSKQPPPLPQKPNSAKNSPLVAPKFPDKPFSGRPIPPTPQMVNKLDRPSANIPSTSTASTNPFDILSDSANSNQISNQNSLNGSPQFSNNSFRGIISTSSSSASSKNATPLFMKKQISADNEDFGSEDALRGIESGLRNMERAMQEQMTIRSMEAAAQAKNDKRNFNTIDFKRNIGGSVTSLDGSANTVTTGPIQNMSVIESMRMALGKNMRSMERGLSMDQMRMDQMHLTNNMRAMEANTGNMNNVQRPLENHMKSLDRNLPLELQYSRHHHRTQSQQEVVEQVKPTAPNPATTAAATAAISREDLRMRRRSSHDENQMAQIQNNNNGKLLHKMRRVVKDSAG